MHVFRVYTNMNVLGCKRAAKLRTCVCVYNVIKERERDWGRERDKNAHTLCIQSRNIVKMTENELPFADTHINLQKLHDNTNRLTIMCYFLERRRNARFTSQMIARVRYKDDACCHFSTRLDWNLLFGWPVVAANKFIVFVVWRATVCFVVVIHKNNTTNGRWVKKKFNVSRKTRVVVCVCMQVCVCVRVYLYELHQIENKQIV